MIRVFAPLQHSVALGRLELDRDESHYLVRVRRARPGQRVQVLDGRSAFEATVRDVDPMAAVVEVEARCPAVAPTRIEIAIGLPDPRATLDAIARACEGGAARLVMVACEHGQRATPSTDRIAKTLRASQRQCGRPDAMAVDGPVPLADWLATAAARTFVAAPGATPATVDAPDRGNARVLIGPEGGLSRDELARCLASGCTELALGPWILRTEIAVTAALCRLTFG